MHLADTFHNPQPHHSDSGWRASLNVHISHDQIYQAKTQQDLGRSFLKHWSHHGPLKLQRAFYPEGPSICHLTLLHPPGGLVVGDQLSLDFKISEKAHGLITTPSAGKFYRSDASQRKQTQTISATLANNATLEWLPQENIIFDGANAQLDNHFLLEPSASLIGWDINCLGRPAANERFENGLFRQKLQLWQKQPPNLAHSPQLKPLYIENSHYIGGSKPLTSKCGLQGYPVFGTFFSTHETQKLAEIRNALADSHCISSASQLPNVLVCRYLGHSTEQAKTLFTRVWDIIRQEQFNRPACRPRIWNT
ncbi:MAG: urease accessory protein UreD [Pseudomonadales bacterium]|nr:urease accessory protein UreD [Pseudomonadales bacterium]